YSYGGSKCCKADVVPEEQYGMSVQAAVTDDGDEFKKEGAKPAPEQQRYQDSAAGAIQMLRDYADSRQVDLKGATARPDPQVQGVWEVKMKNGDRAVVYLAGYREPSGNIRATNDFEYEDAE